MNRLVFTILAIVGAVTLIAALGLVGFVLLMPSEMP